MTKKEPDGDGEKAMTATEKRELAKATDTRWKARTADLHDRRKQMAGNILQYRYDVGLFAVEVVEDKAKMNQNRLYGTHTMEDICSAIGESSSTVHSCVKFVRKVSTKELEEFKIAEFPWRAVASLITVDDAKAYKALKDKFAKGAFDNSDQLKAAVKDANVESKKTGKKGSKQGGSSTAAAMVKSFNTMFDQATSKIIPDLVKAISVFKKQGDEMSEVAVEAIVAGLKEAKKKIRTVEAMLGKAKQIIEASGV